MSAALRDQCWSGKRLFAVSDTTDAESKSCLLPIQGMENITKDKKNTCTVQWEVML